MLELGTDAPNFSLQGSDDNTHSLNEYKGRYLVLYFYPKDDTPGCTTEAKGFTKEISSIRKLGAEVVGVSSDGLESHSKFCSKYSLSVLLLSDPESRTIKEYNAYGNMGVFGYGTLRKTYIIDPKGKIAKIYEKVNPDGHENEIIEFLKDKN